MLRKNGLGTKYLRVITMVNDFVCTSANDGTHLFRPVSAKAHTFWQNQNFNKFVIDNNEDYYIVKSVDAGKIFDEIRKNNMDFTS